MSDGFGYNLLQQTKVRVMFMRLSGRLLIHRMLLSHSWSIFRDVPSRCCTLSFRFL